MIKLINLCDFRSVPSLEKECLEVVWSEGTSCSYCPLTGCYRRGWSKEEVDVDNKKLVADKRKLSTINGHVDRKE